MTSIARKMNGDARAPKGANGTHVINGINGINGAVKSPLNNHAIRPRRTTRPRGSGLFGRTLSIVARLVTWYSIFTILFRCPPSLDACDDASPPVCRPYFQLKRAVAPHVEPYYDTYAAPYVDLVRPYYGALDERVITPGWRYAKQYGAPRLEQVQALGQAQWERTVQPRLEQYQDRVRAQYDERLAPHIHRVSTAAGPYYEIARTSALQTYHELLLPAYQYAQPHLWEGYRATSAFTASTVVPAFVWTWNKSYAFLDGTVGPQLRAIYAENVEPQLLRIGKRLGRYSTGKKSVPKPLQEISTSAAADTTSSFTKPAASVPVTSAAPPTAVAPSSSVAPSERASTAADGGRSRAAMEPVSPPEADEHEQDDPVRRDARQTVAADLKDWQERYAKAADEGAAEIDERVQEIAKKMIRRNARITGNGLVEQLKNAAVSQLVSLRRAVLDVIEAASRGDATTEQAQERIVQAVRQAGMAVKDRAQAVRTWREAYETEMQAAITQAAETHFAILENIRDLALQKIGMKWAWMDGVTYKDWAKYHLLKSRFDEWKGDLETHIVTHPSLEAAQLEAATIEDEAMKIAASTAKELARLKQVAGWKLAAGDATPEFDSTLMQQAAEAAEAAKLAAAGAAEAVVQSASEATDAVVGGISAGVSVASEAASTGASFVSEAVDEGSSVASQAFSKVNDAMFGSESQSIPPEAAGTPDALSETSEASSAPAAEASLALEDEQTSPSEPEAGPVADEDVEHVGSAAAEGASEPEPEFVAAASNTLLEVIEPTSEPQAHAAGDPLPDAASGIIFETPVMVGNVTEQVDVNQPGPVELPVEVEDSQTEDSEADVRGEQVSNTASVKPALFGAAAQSVPSRQPILDDDDDEGHISEALESMRENMKSAYTSAMVRANEQYSKALSIVSAQIRGTPNAAHEQLLASVTSAYSKAISTASARLDDALALASGQLHRPTTTTTQGILPTSLPVPHVPAVEWARIESIASERLQQGRAWAEEQYESAKIAVGLATPTPSTPAEHVNRLLNNARYNYYAGVGLAHARYSEFLSAASVALSSVTGTPTPTDMAGSASSIASVASESAASVMSAASENASSALSVASEGVSAAAAAGYDKASAAGDSIAEGWEAVVTKISIQVYGAPTPTPWYSSAYSAAGQYASLATAAAGEGAAAASEHVARQYAAASSIVSELLVGKEPSFSESVVSRLSAAYATGAASASSIAAAAQASAASVVDQAGEAVRSASDKAASAGSGATEAVKSTVASVRDEL